MMMNRVSNSELHAEFLVSDGDLTRFVAAAIWMAVERMESAPDYDPNRNLFSIGWGPFRIGVKAKYLRQIATAIVGNKP